MGEIAKKINRQRLFSWLIILLLIFIAVIRFSWLTMSPPGVFSDEMSFGYNAHSIMETGRDEHGIFLPVYFKAFGDYKNPVQVYAMAPVVKIFGLNVYSVRLTSALFGVGSILLFIYFLYILFKNKNLALLGGLMLSAMPWHFFYSRIGFEAMSFVFFIILSMVFFAKFIKTHKDWHFLFFCISIVINFFTYSTARLMIPILAIAVAILWRKDIFKKRANILILVFNILLFSFFIYYDSIINPGGIINRAGSVSVSNFSSSFFDTVKYFFGNYINHFSPQFLFQSGDYNLRHSSGVSSMLLTIFIFPLSFGLAYFIKRIKHSKFAKFIIIAVITFPLASSLTIIEEGAQATRSIHAVPFLAVIIAIGSWEIYELFRKKYKSILILLSFFFLAELSLFYHNYFFVYPIKSANYFNNGLPEAFKAALASNSDFYYISRNVSNFGIEAPFFMGYDPSSYQKDKIINNVKYQYPEKLKDPSPNSVGIYKGTDDTKHFPNEELIHTVFYMKRVVRKDLETGKDYYTHEKCDTYYVYKYK